jgi:hypothetical protein
MPQAMVAAEKLDAVSVHISGISKVLRQHRNVHQQADDEDGMQVDAPLLNGSVATPHAQ